MAKTSFARKLVGNIGQGEVAVNFIDVLVVLVSDEMPPIEQEGSSPFSIIGNAPDRPAAHDPTLRFDVREGLDGFDLGAKNPNVVQIQFFAEMLKMSSPETARFDPDEFPMGESNSQGKEGKARARTEVQPLPGFLELEFLGPKERRERILDVAGEKIGKVVGAHQVLGLARLACQAAQFLQGVMCGGGEGRLGMFHVEPRLRAVFARV